MSERMFDDLSAWEAGALSLAELERTYEREPVHAIVDLHESLRLIASEPVPDASAGWLIVLERMDPPRPAKSRRVHRAFAGALVAAVLSASAAFAAPGAFHAIVEGVRHGVHTVFGGTEGRSYVPSSPGPTGHGPQGVPASDGTGGKGNGGGASDTHGGGGSGSGDQGSGSGDQGSGSGDQGSGSGDQGSGSGDQGSGSGDQGSGSGGGDSQGSSSGGSNDQGSGTGHQGSGDPSGSGDHAGDGGSGSDGSSGN
jgi:hypothetical protein